MKISTINFQFHVIDPVSVNCSKKIEISPKTLFTNSNREIIIELLKSDDINFKIDRFSISQSNSKIAFILEVQDDTNNYKPIINEIYLLDLVENSIPKKIYETENHLTSVHWSPNGKNIIFNENNNVIKIFKNVNSNRLSANESIEILTDSNGNCIKGHVLGWMD